MFAIKEKIKYNYNKDLLKFFIYTQYIYVYMKEQKQKHETSLTSIKIFADKYQSFKEVSDGDFTLQKLVNRSLYLYINNPEYRKMIEAVNDLKKSGSAY